MGDIFANGIYHIANLLFLITLAIEIISLAQVGLNPSKKEINETKEQQTQKSISSIFGETKKSVDFGNIKEEVADIGLDRIAISGAVILPLFIIICIYKYMPHEVSEAVQSYRDGDFNVGTFAGTTGKIMFLLLIYSMGIQAGRKFYVPNSKMELYNTNNVSLLKKRFIPVQIMYFSTVFFMIVSTYFSGDTDFVYLKALGLSFVAGNMWYIVVRYNFTFKDIKEGLTEANEDNIATQKDTNTNTSTNTSSQNTENKRPTNDNLTNKGI